VTRAAITLAAVLAVYGCGGPKPVAVTPASPATLSAADRLQADLTAIFSTAQFERSFWSVLVRPVNGSANLYTLNAAKLMMPGSAMKIVTAATAAETLGWDYRFETRIVSMVPIESGVLGDDLYIVGGGDPSISERSDTPGTLRAIRATGARSRHHTHRRRRHRRRRPVRRSRDRRWLDARQPALWVLGGDQRA
jgi:D-alanyl-D-alanine carboxypeptidase/D-alanyl-D-alanine-endopeptidase (penicillin-binding protein 4)